MKLSELAALPKNQIRVIDRTIELHYPAKWNDWVHFIYKDTSTKARRYNAFLSGLCNGSKDAFPTPPERGGLRQNCGRKAIDPKSKKVQVIIGVKQSVIDSLGGLREVQKLLIEHIKTRI